MVLFKSGVRKGVTLPWQLAGDWRVEGLNLGPGGFISTWDLNRYGPAVNKVVYPALTQVVFEPT